MHIIIMVLLMLISTVLQLLLLDEPYWILLAIAVMMVIVWLISLPLKNTGIIDIFWGPAFIVGSLCALWLNDWQANLPNVSLVTMISLWGVRLALHIFKRSIGQPEDKRYAKWREEGGELYWLRALFTTFLLQAVMAWTILAPFNAHLLQNTFTQVSWLAWVGIAVWLFGFCYEAIADWQLAKFKNDQDNKGKLLTTGLWQYSRHPNYFGEAVVWWGLYIFSFDYGGALFFIGPLLITYSLLKFSGVTLLEDDLKDSKPGYEEYMKSTPTFLPKWLVP